MHARPGRKQLTVGPQKLHAHGPQAIAWAHDFCSQFCNADFFQFDSGAAALSPPTPLQPH